MKRVTIRDVAREAGVSPSTVSRALKGHALISQQTRQAVEDACLRLRYVRISPPRVWPESRAVPSA